jgi:hypothetical protein
VALIATSIFSSNTSISKVVVVSLGAKGLCLHESSRTRGFGGKSIAVALKEEPSQLKTTHGEELATLKPKVGEFTSGINLFKQLPSFTTDYLIPMVIS